MPLKTRSKRRGRLSMTSLIDVIFLLLLFFMLTSTFSKYAEVELMAAGGGVTEQDPRQKLFVSLAEEQLMLNGQTVDLERIIGLMPFEGRQLQVLISPDETASAQRLVDLLVTLREIPDMQSVVLQ